jgi:hypothetical protein
MTTTYRAPRIRPILDRGTIERLDELFGVTLEQRAAYRRQRDVADADPGGANRSQPADERAKKKPISR